MVIAPQQVDNLILLIAQRLPAKGVEAHLILLAEVIHLMLEQVVVAVVKVEKADIQVKNILVAVVVLEVILVMVDQPQIV